MRREHGDLPVQRTSFVGRQRERELIRRALRDAQVLTLTGVGGIGKTRLALQVATEEQDRFPDGAKWVDLAPLTEPESVPDAVAEAFQVRPLPGMTSLQAVSASLASRRALVVLDNCEHLLAASAEVAGEISRSATHVSVLATSRTPLGIPDEQQWSVPALSESEAGSLFAERAGQADHSFELSAENAGAVARICDELEGIPLALEIAAARTRVLSANQIADALAERLRLLGGGPRRSEARHQTLRASIDWSHELLDERERALFRRLAVFGGGHDLAAAEAVCGFAPLSPDQVLDLLDSLVEKSLVATKAGGPQVRFTLLETMRQYCWERLEAGGELEATRDRHLEHFLGMAERAAPNLGRAGESEWFDELDIEANNMAAAIDHAVEREPATALALSDALAMWRRARRPLSESEAAYARVLAASAGEPPGSRGPVMSARAYIAVGAGDLAKAEEFATDALALADEAEDPSTAARALAALGLGESYSNPAGGRTHLLRAAQEAESAGDDWARIEAAQFAALSFLFQDRHEEIEAVLAGVDELTDAVAEGGHLARRALIAGSVRLLDGELDSAEAVLESALTEIDADAVVEAWVGAQVGLVDTLRGAPDEAGERLDGLLDTALESGGGLAVPALLIWTAFAELSKGAFDAAEQRLAGVMPIVDGRDVLLSLWGFWLQAESRRMLGREDAGAAAERAVSLGDRVGNRLGAGRGHLTLARLAVAGGDLTGAEQHALTALDACAEGGHTTFVPECLDALAVIAAGSESHVEAARLLGAAAAGRESLGTARFVPEDEHWVSVEGGARSALGEADFSAALQEGRELGLKDAVAWRRRARGSRKRPSAGWQSLTPTEAKVAELVAQGMSNPEVGEKMFVSRATVKTHLSHIYRKLEIAGRAQLAAEAARRRD